MILVVGATGVLGGQVARGLLRRGDPVRVLVRPASDYRPLEEVGADVAFGDLKDPGCLPAALRDVQVVVTTANSAKRGGSDTVEAVDLRGNMSLVAAAARAGVEQFVYVSGTDADAASPVPFVAAKGKVEERLRACGMPYTIVRPEPFMEDWIAFVIGSQLVRGNRVLLVGEGSKRWGFVAVADVAALLLSVIGDRAALGQVITLTGDSASYREVVASYSALRGEAIDVGRAGPGEAIPSLPPRVVELWAALESAPERQPGLEGLEVARRFGLRLTPIETFLRGLHA